MKHYENELSPERRQRLKGQFTHSIFYGIFVALYSLKPDATGQRFLGNHSKYRNQLHKNKILKIFGTGIKPESLSCRYNGLPNRAISPIGELV